ncbi:integral membrane sensor signal transduction histidine kinase [Desulfofundulus kuznetsovii DSM 6115]|uniref:histidine kinase n=1 Tax=Desulfofundulus kuznetsovii (strain DSM 6115 / VKM B-1805 / 17) TaxID=760568 RepID=A0AAU8P8C4_DESK7|nr:integral membrane sensor signal transduction histidine kinase [Desulfofundulus kuznetsovii DSM 6115]
MVNFRPQSFKLQLISIVAILLIVPVLVMLYDILFASRTDDQLIKDMQNRLVALGDHLGEQMEARALEQWKANPRPDLTGFLVDEFNRLAAPLTSSHPGIRCGLYITGQERIWVQGFLHEYRPRQPETPEERVERIFREAEEGIKAVLAGGQPITRIGQTWDDQFLEYLVPVRIQGKVVAVVWVEERLHPLFARSARVRLLLRYATLGIFSFAVVATLASILSLVRGVGRLKEGLLELEKNLEARIPEMPGELGEIGRAVNQMAANLAEKEQLVEHLRRSEHLAALGRLVTDIAHELRAPIGIMQSTVEVVRPSLEKDEGMKEPLAIIEEQIGRLNGLIGELLDFGRPGSGMKEVNLNDLISEIAVASRAYLSQNGVELNLSLADGLPPVRGNREKLQQVFLNLIVNAIQAMSGGGRLDIETFASKDGVCAVFRDTGEGIPPEDLEHIFQPFFSRKTRGSGLGLAISQEIVRIHGGSITVESHPGQGTVFTVCLPVRSNGEKEG